MSLPFFYARPTPLYRRPRPSDKAAAAAAKQRRHNSKDMDEVTVSELLAAEDYLHTPAYYREEDAEEDGVPDALHLESIHDVAAQQYH